MHNQRTIAIIPEKIFSSLLKREPIATVVNYFAKSNNTLVISFLPSRFAIQIKSITPFSQM
ncbi:MAG: hypothetical protein AB1397_04185 [bacterium]